MFGKTLRAVFVFLMFAALVEAANQTSASYRVTADVFCSDNPGLASASAIYQATVSAGQRSIVGRQSSALYVVHEGYQATTEGFDSDYDGISDNEDLDDDADGTADAFDARPYDTDNDGRNNVADDDDDDGEGLSDDEEWSAGTSLVKADTDQDQFNDWIEARITGTEPTNSGSYLGLTQARQSGSNVIVSWSTVAGRTNYWLQRSTNLKTTNWSTLAGPITATGSVMSRTDSNAPPASSYRIGIPY